MGKNLRFSIWLVGAPALGRLSRSCHSNRPPETHWSPWSNKRLEAFDFCYKLKHFGWEKVLQTLSIFSWTYFFINVFLIDKTLSPIQAPWNVVSFTFDKCFCRNKEKKKKTKRKKNGFNSKIPHIFWKFGSWKTRFRSFQSYADWGDILEIVVRIACSKSDDWSSWRSC